MVCSACGKVKYCSRECQLADWKQHKRACSGKAKAQPAAQSTSTSMARSACPECTNEWAKCTCEERPACWICLESEGAELLRGCACRGSAGYVHAACMIEANRHRKEDHHVCPTCKQRFVGKLAMVTAAARVSNSQSSHFDADATSDLAHACLEQGDHAEALKLYQQVLQYAVQKFGHEHLLVAKTYNK